MYNCFSNTTYVTEMFPFRMQEEIIIYYVKGFLVVIGASGCTL